MLKNVVSASTPLMVLSMSDVMRSSEAFLKVVLRTTEYKKGCIELQIALINWTPHSSHASKIGSHLATWEAPTLSC